VLALPASVRVYLASEPVDMRRGHDGLFEIVKSWGLDPSAATCSHSWASGATE
jgi:hypothetical protein